VEEPRQHDQREFGSCGGLSRPDLPLLKQRQLLPQEQVFRNEGRTAGQEETEEGEQLQF
jgi:hypothetical protein